MIQPSQSAPRYLRGVPVETRLWGRCKVVGECWEYQGNTNRGGYGTLEWRGRKWKAHRVAYTLAKGEIPDGLEVLHSCDNPPCVNPEHLRVGSQSDNMRDAFGRGRKRFDPAWLASYHERRRAAKTCTYGHPWDQRNTAHRKDGSRYCRTCHRSQVRRSRLKHSIQHSEPEWARIHDQLAEERGQ